MSQNFRDASIEPFDIAGLAIIGQDHMVAEFGEAYQLLEA